MRFNFELPRASTLDALLSLLNDRLRAIAEAIGIPITDMDGERITNLGDGSAPMDALNVRTADRRYATRESVTQQITQSSGASASKGKQSTGGGSASAAASHGTLILSVPGVLAIQSQAAALVSFDADTSFLTGVALLKRAPAGGALTLSAICAGQTLGTVTIPAGKDALAFDASTWKLAAKDGVISIDVTAVGFTFPGSDLTLELRF